VRSTKTKLEQFLRDRRLRWTPLFTI